MHEIFWYLYWRAKEVNSVFHFSVKLIHDMFNYKPLVHHDNLSQSVSYLENPFKTLIYIAISETSFYQYRKCYLISWYSDKKSCKVHVFINKMPLWMCLNVCNLDLKAAFNKLICKGHLWRIIKGDLKNLLLPVETCCIELFNLGVKGLSTNSKF